MILLVSNNFQIMKIHENYENLLNYENLIHKF